MQHESTPFYRTRWIVLFFVSVGLAVLGPSPLQAQSDSEDGPSVDQLKKMLPSTLPSMERAEIREESASSIVGVYKPTGGRAPPRVDVMIMYGPDAVTQAEDFIQRPEIDSTKIPDGRTFHSGILEPEEGPMAVSLWNADPYVFRMEVKGSADDSLSVGEAQKFLEPLRDEMSDAVSADDLPDTDS